jgi:hypothetical protein
LTRGFSFLTIGITGASGVNPMATHKRKGAIGGILPAQL